MTTIDLIDDGDPKPPSLSLSLVEIVRLSFVLFVLVVVAEKLFKTFFDLFTSSIMGNTGTSTVRSVVPSPAQPFDFDSLRSSVPPRGTTTSMKEKCT